MQGGGGVEYLAGWIEPPSTYSFTP